MRPAEEMIAIHDPSDVSLCRRRVAHLATGMGFPAVGVGELAILVSELAENVLRHGGGRGQMSLAEIAGEPGRGIEIVCTDAGPGFDERAAFTDGFSTSGTLGIGLGAVARLADSCEILPPPDGVGARIVARKWLPSQTPPSVAAPSEARAAARFDVGARSRPYPGYNVNGDAYVVRYFKDDGALVAVIDGLGHGADAHEAAQTASDLIEAQAQLDFPALFHALDQRLRRTRGAVVAMAQIDLLAAQLTFAGIGNIEAVLLEPKSSQQLVCTGGIVGHTMRPPHLFTYRWTPESLLLLCSDGIRSAWRAELDRSLLSAHPDVLVNAIIGGYARETDDATALGIRQKRQ